jgi:lysophospholipase L1-like esterase
MIDKMTIDKMTIGTGKTLIMKFIFCFLWVLTFCEVKAFAFPGLVVLGDSLATGAATKETLQFDPVNLWDLVQKPTAAAGDVGSRPKRFWPAQRENDGASGWVWNHMIHAISDQYFNAPELSYGVEVGRGLGLTSDQVWIAAENGARAEAGSRQLARVLETSNQELPTFLLAYFTGNDLCAQTFADTSSADEYANDLFKTFKLAIDHGRQAPGETLHILVPAFLQTTQLVLEDAINNKTIPYYGSSISCSGARKRFFSPPDEMVGRTVSQDLRYNLFAKLMPPNPMLLCPTIFALGLDKDFEGMVSQVANRIRAYRDVIPKVEAQVMDYLRIRKNPILVKFHFIQDTGTLKFLGEDIANDCFHLSRGGQNKLGQMIVRGLKDVK